MVNVRLKGWILLLVCFCAIAQAQEERRIAGMRTPRLQPERGQQVESSILPGRYSLVPGDRGKLAFDPALANALQRSLDSVRVRQGVKGMSAAVLVPGQGIWQGVSGVSSQSPTVGVAPGMLFGIGSNTKAFVSSTILSLVDSGKVSLDDPVSRYLPTYPNVTPSVTIRQLLNMTSGLFDYLNDSDAQGDSVSVNPYRFWTPEELIRTFVGPPRSSPGGSYRYCNTDYVLLGMVISSVTGRPVSSQIRQRILAPLALDHTFLEVEESYMDPVAHPWNSGVDFFAVPVTAHFSTLWTAGGIMSTAENMVRWVKALYEGQVISPSSLQAMLTVVPMSSNAAAGLDWNGYGLGVRQGSYYGKKVLGHGGSVMGYVSHTGYLPGTGASFAVLTNTSEADAAGAMTGLLDAYLRSATIHPVPPGCWYAISGKSDSTRLYALDPSKGTLSPIGTTQYGTLAGARVDPRSGTMYGLVSAGGWELVRIDGVTGEAFPGKRVIFPAGAPSDFKGLDFGPDGALYVGSVDGRIYAIDTGTGAAVLAATTRIPVSGLAFDPLSGALWASARTSPVYRDRIYRISLPDGDTAGIGNTGFSQTLSDLEFASNGDLYGLVGNPSSYLPYRLARVDRSTGAGTEIGSLGLSGMVGITFAPGPTGVGETDPNTAGIPDGYVLGQNYPNPFNGISNFEIRISKRGLARVAVYDLLGREVAVLMDEEKVPGRYQVTFDAAGLASGVYVYRLTAGSTVLARKMILAR